MGRILSSEAHAATLYLRRRPPAEPAGADATPAPPDRTQRLANQAARYGVAMAGQQLLVRNVWVTTELAGSALGTLIRGAAVGLSGLVSPWAAASYVLAEGLVPDPATVTSPLLLAGLGAPRYLARLACAAWEGAVHRVPAARLTFYLTHNGCTDLPADCSGSGPAPEGIVCPDPRVQRGGDVGEAFVGAALVALLGVSIGLALYASGGRRWRAAFYHEVAGPPPGARHAADTGELRRPLLPEADTPEDSAPGGPGTAGGPGMATTTGLGAPPRAAGLQPATEARLADMDVDLEAQQAPSPRLSRWPWLSRGRR